MIFLGAVTWVLKTTHKNLAKENSTFKAVFDPLVSVLFLTVRLMRKMFTRPHCRCVRSQVDGKGAGAGPRCCGGREGWEAMGRATH